MFSNTPGRSAYRGPWQFETVSREVLLDIAARQIGIDAVELRRRNLLRLDEMPYPNANGMPYDHISPLETFDEAMRILDLDDFRRQQPEARAPARYLGLGTSSYVEPTASPMGYHGTQSATLRIEPSGEIGRAHVGTPVTHEHL